MNKKNLEIPVLFVQHNESKYEFMYMCIDNNNILEFNSGNFKEDYAAAHNLGWQIKELGLANQYEISSTVEEFMSVAGWVYTYCDCCNEVNGVISKNELYENEFSYGTHCLDFDSKYFEDQQNRLDAQELEMELNPRKKH